MRRKKLTSRFFIVIAIVVAICLLSAVYSGITGNSSPVSKVVGIVTAPIQKIGASVGGFFGKGASVEELQAENAELKKKISEMEQTVRDAALALDENDRLRKQQNMPERNRELTTLSSEVIARNPGEWAVVLTLDKGSSHGVAVNDLVTTENGVVGYVTEVAPNHCEVTTVIDIEMQCGALITRTRASAIAEGNYDLMTEGNLRLSYLKEDADVVIGDTVETSGDGGVFPKGVMIGTVETVLPEENGTSYYAVIKPFVDIETVTSVSVITDYEITE